MQVNMEFEGKNEESLKKFFDEFEKKTKNIIEENPNIKLKKMKHRIYRLDEKSNKLRAKSK